MTTHPKVIQDEKAKGKSASKSQKACEELDYLKIFNQSITHVIARSMRNLSEFDFMNMANVTLLRRDSYFDLLKPGVKFDTVSAPGNLLSFPPQSDCKAEEEISHHDQKW